MSQSICSRPQLKLVLVDVVELDAGVVEVLVALPELQTCWPVQELGQVQVVWEISTSCGPTHSFSNFVKSYSNNLKCLSQSFNKSVQEIHSSPR